MTTDVPGMSPDDERTKAALDHAWNHFQLHASQRIAVFNYFVVASGIAFAGLASAVQAPGRRALAGIPVGIAMMILAIVAAKLDQRGSELVKRAEEALSEAERLLLPPFGRLFARTRGGDLSTGHWSFTRSFRCLFWLVGLFGAGGCAVAIAVAYDLVRI